MRLPHPAASCDSGIASESHSGHIYYIISNEKILKNTVLTLS